MDNKTKNYPYNIKIPYLFVNSDFTPMRDMAVGFQSPDSFVYVSTGDRIWKYDANTAALLGVVNSLPGEIFDTIETDGNGFVYGASFNGTLGSKVWRIDPNTMTIVGSLTFPFTPVPRFVSKLVYGGGDVMWAIVQSGTGPHVVKFSASALVVQAQITFPPPHNSTHVRQAGAMTGTGLTQFLTVAGFDPFGTAPGELWKVNPNNNSVLGPFPTLNSCYAMSNGTGGLFVGGSEPVTSSLGIQRHDTDTLAPIGPSNGSINSIPLDLLHDPNGRLWCCTNTGVAYIDPLTNFTLGSVASLEPFPVRLALGCRLWVGSNGPTGQPAVTLVNLSTLAVDCGPCVQSTIDWSFGMLEF
jgi:hypothetical protein